MTPTDRWWALALAKARAVSPELGAAMLCTYKCAQQRALGG